MGRAQARTSTAGVSTRRRQSRQGAPEISSAEENAILATLRFQQVKGKGYVEKTYAVELAGDVIGEIDCVKVSTDSQIKGTRLRKAGKGRPGWRVTVPADEADNYQRDLMPGGYYSDHKMWLTSRGKTFDTRAEAALALLRWRLHPELHISEDEA